MCVPGSIFVSLFGHRSDFMVSIGSEGDIDLVQNNYKQYNTRSKYEYDIYAVVYQV